MSFPVAFVLAVAGLIVSARTQMHAVLLGQPVVIPWLGVAAAVLILILAALVLHLIRVLREEFPRKPEPRYVHVITTAR